MKSTRANRFVLWVSVGATATLAGPALARAETPATAALAVQPCIASSSLPVANPLPCPASASAAAASGQAASPGASGAAGANGSAAPAANGAAGANGSAGAGVKGFAKVKVHRASHKRRHRSHRSRHVRRHTSRRHH
jgi:hypothetical protein